MHSTYSYTLRHDAQGRIIEKTETVQGAPAVWTYAYDHAGRLAEAKLNGRFVCQCRYDKQGCRSHDWFPRTHGSQIRNFSYTMANRLQSAGNNGYTHDKQGMRLLWNHGGNYTRYEYATDHRLLRATREWDDTVFEFAHDDNGQRAAKFRDGTLIEAYHWRDFIRLAAFHDGTHEFVFVYRSDERTPHAMRRDDGAVFTLHYDQVGSLRVVADQRGNVIQEVLYDPFGGIIEDTCPGLRIPIGFAGGLHDRDLGFVRFGWRDYDTFTGRWTAPDPLGDKGGDPDWYGYCLDDPVNGVDPLGLLVWFLPFVAGMAGATAIGATGAYSAAKVADWLGEKAGKNHGKDKPTATEGVHDAMGKVIGINSGIVGAAGTAKAAPAAAAAAMQHPEKLAAGSKAAADFASSALVEGPPESSPAGYWGSGVRKAYDEIEDWGQKR
ncbi:MAG: RHS repeat-associated core domain-containing protein [Pseudodesulfovibrio sp.]|uniref:RHS repeat domain-containing protein n=1 Tax=Pseudodesulfovibrio sp. TaxID=2035812 RepID=UPI001D92F9C1|nr:RHS repeat-associated core domain-containing protein [Pseudodesulfovibrio sp.]MBU4557840.1 RHS repeat-associated core domain-containing protein [Pseudomonadota bacterium]MBV1766335.1 RHS repeat-associated core domain-containing protein [Pseudodesulfovibrio sp.]